jgi:pimeloyl-ACP methyl ester carboxylesterase
MFALIVICGWLWTPDESRAELEARYSQAATDFLPVAGMRMHVRISGPADAPAIVLLHGLGSSLHTWEAWAQQLEGYRVIRIDLPGFGLTGPDPGNDYSDEHSVQVLLALMDQLKLDKASVIGHSMGGRLAWRFAADHPERVEKLVLISPDGFASPGFEYGKAPEVPATMNLMRYAMPKSLLRMNLLPGYANPKVATDALVTRYYDMMLAPGVRGAILERMRQTVLQDPVPFLNRIHAPTLLVWGEQDQMIPFHNSADYLRALPNATLVPLPGVGHLPQEEAPSSALEPVKAFLAKPVATAARRGVGAFLIPGMRVAA